MLDALSHLVADTPRGLVVAGWGAAVDARTLLRFAEAAGWPVLADPISGLRVPGTVSTYDPLLRVPSFAAVHRPDVVVPRSAARSTNKVAMQWLDADVAQVLVDPDGAWLDPSHARQRHAWTPTPSCCWSTFADAIDVPVDEEWTGAVASAPTPRRAARSTSCSTVGTSRSRVGSLATCTPRCRPTATLVVASSMPVRDVESFAAARVTA